MSFRRLFGSPQGRFLVLTGRRPSSSTTASATALHQSIVNGRRRPQNPHSPITQMRLEFRSFLESIIKDDEPAPQQSDQNEAAMVQMPQFTAVKMKEMLKRAVEVGDVELFSAMLSAVPDPLLTEIDPDQSLLSYSMVKMTELSALKPAAEAMCTVLSRCTNFDPFLCELLFNRILEESDVIVWDQFSELLKTRHWQFPLDHSMTDQLITDVYLPNSRFDDIKALFTQHQFSTDTISLVLCAIVNPDPATPLEPQYSTLPSFLNGINKSESLASALEHLFSVHPPPDHILKKLLE